MAITALPTPPSRSDPANFAARGDALLGALPTLVTEMNAATTEVDADRAAAAVSASAALASQNAAATSAGNASTSSSSSAASAAAALAAAAATQAGLPAQTSTNGMVLRSEQGVAAWTGNRGIAQQVVYSQVLENEISNSSALNYAAWSLGTNISLVTFEQSIPGPNGLRSVQIQCSGAPGNQYVTWPYTPQVGVSRTAKVWWRGLSKPSFGQLIRLDYRDAGNSMQSVALAFADSQVIADGKWRQYSVSATHQGSDVSPVPMYICVDPGAGTYNFADPQILPTSVYQGYVATGPTHALEMGKSYDFDSAAGVLSTFLPPSSLGIYEGACISIKDYGRFASTNNIAIARNGAAIENALNDLAIDVDGVSIDLVYSIRKGWLIK